MTHTSTEQPEALRLADICAKKGLFAVDDELRRLHAESELHLQELRSYRITVENREARIVELEKQLAAVQQGWPPGPTLKGMTGEMTVNDIAVGVAAQELSADALDAKRYRWLRRKVCIVGGKFHILNLDPRYIAPDAAIELDSAIDSAIAAQAKQGGAA